MKKSVILFLIFFYLLDAFGQNAVSITIDDIPYVKRFEKDGYKSELLNTLDSLQIPIAVFVNESRIYHTDSVNLNIKLLDEWAKREYVTLANHSYSHPRYSDVGFDIFTADIIKGEFMIKELAQKYDKTIKYFRFPFNDCGKDSLQQDSINIFLKNKGYIITPFTIESSDYLYNELFEYYIDNKLLQDAERISNQYLDFTITLFDYFDSLTQAEYGRKVKQIYLCHDNPLNGYSLPKLIERLKRMEYKFISLDEAMNDKIYNQPSFYYKKYGVSWVFRWVKDSDKRKLLFRSEPDVELLLFLQEYKKVLNKNP